MVSRCLTLAVILTVALVGSVFAPCSADREFSVEAAEVTIEVPPDEDPDPEYELNDTLAGQSDHFLEVRRSDAGNHEFSYSFRSFNTCTGKEVKDYPHPKQRKVGGDWEEDDDDQFTEFDMQNQSELDTTGAFAFNAYIEFMEHEVDPDLYIEGNDSHGFKVSNP